MKLPAQDKKRAVFAVLHEGESITSVAKDFGVSRKTIYSWVKRYKKAPSRIKSKSLSDRYVKGKKHPRALKHLAKKILERLIVKHPKWGTRKFSAYIKNRGIDLGYIGVYELLCELGANTYHLRLNFSRNYSGPGRYKGDVRLEIVRKALGGNFSISNLSQEYGLARKTIYKWIEDYRESDSLEDSYVSGKAHPRAIYPQITERVLGQVIEAPELSIRDLSRLIKVSSWTIWSILDKKSLSNYNQRLAYSQSAKAELKPAPTRFLDKVRYVLEQFVPNLAPAPPPGGKLNLRKIFKGFGASTFLTFLISYSALYFINFLVSVSLAQAIGLIFATVALFMGSLFFLYSLKYYVTLAIVLSFSQSEQGARDREQVLPAQAGKGNGIISWLLGLGGNGKRETGNGKRSPTGLEPNLEHISLSREPYISVHIPFYNEKRVVARAIKAATSLDYPNYEVILCDDSTDETSKIIGDYLGKLQNSKTPKLQTTKGEGWEMTQVEVRPGVTLKHLHRTSRSGYKGGALRQALRVCDTRTEFISVFDADFVPYPDTLTLFLKYFQATAGTLDFQSKNNELRIKNNGENHNSSFMLHDSRSNIAAVQGYQWHVLNKSENWITRGVRSEYAGSYVIERSGEEIYGGLKQISGAVYMIRRDVLDQIGWETSITEDFQLTLKLYEAGYKVVYTPYIQAPAECVSTLKRLIRQRMRWAEGHSHNVRKMFTRLMFGKWEVGSGRVDKQSLSLRDNEMGSGNIKSHLTLQSGANPASHLSPHTSRKWTPSPLTLSEKLEFLYLSPYYLQAFFFLVGTLSWLVSETFFPARLPFWTSLWGWSLVLTNMFSLPLMNAVGLFLEESEERDYQGLASFTALTYILVPFQAYAALKGFLQSSEGPWFRTPKTGRITDVFARGRFYRFISGILPGRTGNRVQGIGYSEINPNAYTLNPNSYLSLATANSRFSSFAVAPRANRAIGKIGIFVVVGLSTIFSFFGNRVPQGAIADLPIQARVEVTSPNYSVTEQIANLLKPKEVFAAQKLTHNFLGINTTDEAVGVVLILFSLLSLSFLLYLIRRKRKFLKRLIRPLFVLALVASWLLASFPGIPFLNFPPRVHEAHAQLGAIKVEHIDFDIGAGGSTKTVTDVGSLNSAFFRNNTGRRTSGGPTSSTSNSNWDVFSAGAQLTGQTTLTAYRAGSQSSQVKMRGEVWRYVGASGGDNEFIVRWRGAVTIGSGSTTASQSVSGISNRNDVIPFVQGVVINAANVTAGNQAIASAYINSSDQLVVTRGLSGTALDVYVVVVEFTGANWSVGHANLTSPSTGANNLTLLQNSDGTGSTFDTTDWTTAFIEASMKGSTTSSNYALEDTWFVVEPRSGVTTDVTITFDSTAGLTGAEVFVHVLKHNNMVVTRYTKSVSIPASANNTVSGLTALNESALEWYVFTDGTGTAYARGATTAYLTSTTNVAEWTHRTGNTGTYRYGVIDLSGVVLSIPTTATLYPDDGGSNQIGFNNIKLNDQTPILRASATCVTNFTNFEIEFNTTAAFDGTSYTQIFTSTYTSDTQYNLQTTGSLGLPATDGVTYYVRVRASADSQSNWGPWSTGTWTYTYTISAGAPEWFQTTDEQFDTGTLAATQTSGSDSVQLPLPYDNPGFETGEATVSDSLSWTTINLVNSYSSNPVILVTPVTATNCEAAGTCAGNNSVGGKYPIPLVRNVSTTSFDISMCVDGGGSQACATGVSSETFDWFAFDINDDDSYSWIEIDTVSSVAVDGSGTGVTYSTSFTNTPAVWLQAQTYSQSGNLGAHGWANPLSTTGFTLNGCAHDATSIDICYSSGSAETFGYIAIDVANEAFPSNVGFQSSSASISNSVWTAASFSPSYTSPRVMVTQDSEGGTQDPHYPWARNVTTSDMEFRYCEQDDGTTCNSHNAEDVYWFSVEQSGSSSGTIMSTEIDYDWFDNATTWNQVYWSEDETNGAVGVQVYYTVSTACDTIVPDGALSGNSSGFATSPINISALSTSTYNVVCIRATLTDSGGTPYLEDWGVTVPENLLMFLGLGLAIPLFAKRRWRKMAFYPNKSE